MYTSIKRITNKLTKAINRINHSEFIIVISVAGYLSGVILLSVGDFYLKSMRVLRFIETGQRPV